MTQPSTATAYDICGELFAAYPLAVDPAGAATLMLADGDDLSFYIVSRHDGDGAPFYWLWPWRSGKLQWKIDTGTGPVPAEAADVLHRGVPLPLNGSLFGFLRGGAVTALAVVYVQYKPERPVPSWSLMPLAGTPEADWPPLALFGQWFWDRYATGDIVSLAGLVAATRETVFWSQDEASGWGSMGVAADVAGPGYVLQQGVYAYTQALLDGPAPTLGDVLGDPGKVDLAPRFAGTARG